ncbi:MAG: hypothetical protein M3Z24_12075 [Chloroflexota bacterium]|nr:hypothetical protein [Chloroflexota bacterium]
MLIKFRVKRNTYFDSITLMKIARFLTGMSGIEEAAAIMATEPNLQLLADAGLTPSEGVVGPSDVLIVVRANSDADAEAALQAAEEQLAQPSMHTSADAESNGKQQPRSIEQAIQLSPGAQLAVISVPGPYAALEAEQALRAGLHVFLFSDNVPLEDEIRLKQLAHSKGLLLMGPDCGTAMLNGIGLGFVNVVPNGPIGIVGASGTGIQQVMSLIAQHGSGVSQGIGCGGRDLSEAVGAITTLQGLQILQEDEQTRAIVLISKPPAPSVAERVLEAASASTKPVIVIFVGADVETLRNRYGEPMYIARTLAEAAQMAVDVVERQTAPEQPQGEIVPGYSQGETGHPQPEPGYQQSVPGHPHPEPGYQHSVPGHPQGDAPTRHETSIPNSVGDAKPSIVGVGLAPTLDTSPTLEPSPILDTSTPSTVPASSTASTQSQRYISALFSGGTLCDEAMHIWAERLGPVYSNIPLQPEWRLTEGEQEQRQRKGHRAIDFGADEYTRGRPHPMIDPALRLKRFQEEARDPQVRVLLLDIVLGYCAHPDPASVYVPAIREAREQAGRELPVVISLCGTEDDPQRLSQQATKFREAGAEVFTSNADAALRCIEVLYEQTNA